MSDVLLIARAADTDEELLAQVTRVHASRVTVLLEEAPSDWRSDDSSRGRALRRRVAQLVSDVERRTGAVVVGLAGSRDQLRGWRFDRTIGAAGPA